MYQNQNSAIFAGMWSFKSPCLSIVFGCLLLLAACSENTPETTHFKTINLSETPLFHLSQVGAISEPPTQFPEIWNRNALRKMGIRGVTLIAKGGKNPDDTLEMIRFSYSNDWKKLRFIDKKNDANAPFSSRGEINYHSANSASGEIQFEELFGIKKQSNTSIQAVKNGYLLLNAKRFNRYDSTWVIGSFLQPEAIVSKIGKSIYSVDVFLPDGSSNKDIERAFQRIPQLAGGFSSAQCSVIFTSGGKPVSAFQLNESFSQVSQTREWTYDKELLTGYTEWFGNTTVREIKLSYENSSQLPASVTIDRNTYFCHYE